MFRQILNDFACLCLGANKEFSTGQLLAFYGVFNGLLLIMAVALGR
jgi:hypothetical protein